VGKVLNSEVPVKVVGPVTLNPPSKEFRAVKVFGDAVRAYASKDAVVA
jgi:hypothetical protein